MQTLLAAAVLHADLPRKCTVQVCAPPSNPLFVDSRSKARCCLQETRDFFANTKVVAAIVPREGGTEDSMTQKFTKGNMFTHHQKSVIVDAQDAKCASPFSNRYPPTYITRIL